MAENGASTRSFQSNWKIPISVFFNDARSVFRLDSLGLEILRIAIPAALALAADPVASLIDTVFIGHIGAVELAAVGVSIAIFNQASKVTVYPLVSITTSFVAEEETVEKLEAEAKNRENQAQLSTEMGNSKENISQDELGKLEEGSFTKTNKDEPLPLQGPWYQEELSTEKCNSKKLISQDELEKLEEGSVTDTNKDEPLPKQGLCCQAELSTEKGNSEEMISQDELRKLEEGSITNTNKDEPLPKQGPCCRAELSTEKGNSVEMISPDELGKLKEGSVTNTNKDEQGPCNQPELSAEKGNLRVKFKTKKSVSNLEKVKGGGKRNIPSASTAIVLGLFLGLCQTVFLFFGDKMLLGIMGVKHDSPMLKPAIEYLRLRSFGAPAVLLSLAMQGVFRGFKDTKTPLYATVAADLSNIVLDAVLIFACHLGVSGAAIAHVLSQYLMAFILLWRLMKEVNLMAPSLKQMQFGRFLQNGLYLFTRVIAVTFCVTLAASLAARLGATPMAAFQICLQVWMASSLLADGLAVAGQAILASSFAEKDYEKATAAATRVLQMGFVLGIGLAIVVGIGLEFGGRVFTTNVQVLHLISLAIPFVAATQPINTLSFVFDGVNFGASDFAYSAYSMVLVAIVSVASLFLLYKSNGFVGIWIALTIYMALRTFAGIWRMGTGTGPWRFLRSGSLSL